MHFGPIFERSRETRLEVCENANKVFSSSLPGVDVIPEREGIIEDENAAVVVRDLTVKKRDPACEEIAK